MKKIAMFLFVIVLLSLVATACVPEYAVVESDNRAVPLGYVEAPVDPAVYYITGTIIADVGSLSRQIEPAYGGAYNGYGYYQGETVDGKTYLRVLVESISPVTDKALPGHIVLVKATDTKATALLPGDRVDLKCRSQFEAIAPVNAGEAELLTTEAFTTWEFDFCRLTTGIVTVK